MEEARKQKLRALTDAVRSFFEVTSAAANARGWSGAFDGIRRNDYLAESFLAELRALIDHLEVELDPPASAAPARKGGPGREWRDGPSTEELWADRTPPKRRPDGPDTAEVLAPTSRPAPPAATATGKDARPAAPPARPVKRGATPRPVIAPPPRPPARVAPPPPPPPRGRRNGYAELSGATMVSRPPEFSSDPDEKTGPTLPRKRR